MTPQQLVDKARNSKEFKYKYYGWSDSDIYNDIQTQYPDIEFPEFEEAIPESDSLMDADTSPGLFEWLGTASISTIGAEAGGVNEDFWKDSYNKSIAGLIYKSIHGEDRYKDVDYEADWLRQAGQFAVGLLSPIELAIFAASGLGGTLAKGAVSKIAMKGLKDGVSRAAVTSGGIQTGKHLLHNIATGAVEMGISGGMFSAAHGAVHSAAEQKELYGTIDAGKTMLDASKSFLESLPLYMATGGVVGGAFKTLNTFAGLEQYSNRAFGEKVNKLLTGQIPQVGAEAVMFSTLPAVMGMEGAASFGSEEWWGEVGKNTLIIGGLRGMMRVWHGKQEGVDVLKMIDTELKFQGSSLKEQNNALKNVKESVADLNIPKREIMQKIIENEVNIAAGSKDSKLTKTNGKKLIEILNKMDDEKFIEKLKKGDADVVNEVTFLMKEGGFLNLTVNSLIKDVLRNDVALERHYKAQNPGKEVTESNLKIFKQTLEVYGKNIDEFFDTINNAIRGDIKSPQGAKPVAKASLEPVVAGQGKDFYKKFTKKQIVNEYNTNLDRYIAEKFPNAKPAQIQRVKDSFKIDETLSKDVIIEKMFGLREGVTKLTSTTQASISKTKVGESIKDLKSREQTSKSLQEKVGKEEKFWGEGSTERRQEQIIEIHKQNTERKAPDNLSTKQKKIHKDNQVVVQDMLINEYMRARGGASGQSKRQTLLSIKAIKEKINLLNELSDFATSRSKRFFELTETDIRDFLTGRKGALDPTTVHDLIKKYKTSFVDEAVRNLDPNTLQGMVKPIVPETKGFRVDYIVDNKTGRQRDGIDITTSKFGKDKTIPITERLKTALFSIFKRNKNENNSYRHSGPKVIKEGKYTIPEYEFLFTDIYGKALKDTQGAKLLKLLATTKAWEKAGLKGISYTSDSFRKSFTTYIKEVAKDKGGVTRKAIIEAADQYILGHRQGGAVQEAYFNIAKSTRKALERHLENYSRIIEGKLKAKEFIKGDSTGKNKHITPYEIRELIKGIDELSTMKNGKEVIRVGNSFIEKQTAIELLIYKGQSGGRVSEVLPTNSFLKDIKYEAGYKQWLKDKGVTTKTGGTGTGGTSTGGAGPLKLSAPDFSKSSNKRITTTIKDTYDALFERLGIKGKGFSQQRADIKEWINESLGLESKYKLKNETDFDMLILNADRIYSAINKLDPMVAKTITTKKSFWSSYHRITREQGLKDRLRITDEHQKTMLTELGVKDGNLIHAKDYQIKTYESMLNSIETTNLTPVSWLNSELMSNVSKLEVRKKLNTFLGIKKATLPIHMVLNHLGLKKLAGRLFNHTSAELAYAGKIYDFEYVGHNLLGKRKFDKIKEHFYLLDKDRYFERLNDGLLTSAEKTFIKNTINTDKWTIKSGATGEVVKAYKSLMKFYKESTIDILKTHLGQAGYERFVKEGHLKWIHDSKNIYVSRRVTEQFKEMYMTDTKWIEREVMNQSTRIATKMARDKYKEAVPSKEKIAEFINEASIIAEQELRGAFEFNPGKFSSSFIKPRHIKLPEFIINHRGKKIEVYETKYERTVNAYTQGMGKFLSNLEFFPEYVTLKGFRFKGRNFNIKGLDRIDPNLGQFVDKIVKRHLGIEKTGTEYTVAATRAAHYAAVLAKLQLSSPTSGLKNIVVGTGQSMLAFKMRHLAQGMLNTINTDNRRFVRSLSAHELGMRFFSPDKISAESFADKYIFPLGLMRPTEKLNRYFAVMASLLDQKELVRTLKHYEPTTRVHKKSIKRLKDFYKLSDKEINLLKKYGANVESINVREFKDSIEAGKVIRQIQVANQKMSTMAHINTQGASIDLFMPEWASGQFAKSALLYKRMAYAATTNTYNNMKLAWETKSPMAFAWFGLGTYYGGETMIWVYNNILGQTAPHRNSSASKMLQTTLWKAEFGGLLSEFLSPYGLNGIRQGLQPAVVSSAELFYTALSNSVQGKKFWFSGEPKKMIGGQQTRELAVGHIGFINAILKTIERGNNPYYKGVMKNNQLHREFTKEMNKLKDFQPNTDAFSMFEKSRYMEAFYKMFHGGTEKEFARWYVLSLFSKASDLYLEGRAPGSPGKVKGVRNANEAFKEAHSIMEAALERLNPVREIINPKTGKIDVKGIRVYRYKQWLARKDYIALKKANPKASEKALWEKAFKISKNVKDMEKLQATYQHKMRQFKKNFPKYYKDMNVDILLQKFGITKIL